MKEERPTITDERDDSGVTPAADLAPAADARARAEANGDGALTREAVLEALKEVLDPELGINIVDLGLVYDVSIEGDTVHITYTLTTMGCPIGPLIEAQMQQLLAGVEGVKNVEAEMVLRPAWTPEMMSEEAKAALGYF
ncbi:MAG TPA: metal-sulfur cluster assembly factor [Actinomycetota bacterium]|nr:metal-sulfur cluster assembly factor [Actinomycetota bacterium]